MVQSTTRVRVCIIDMGEFGDPKFSEQGRFFDRSFLNIHRLRWNSQNLLTRVVSCQNSSRRIGKKAIFGNQKGAAFCNPTANPLAVLNHETFRGMPKEAKKLEKIQFKGNPAFKIMLEQRISQRSKATARLFKFKHRILVSGTHQVPSDLKSFSVNRIGMI